MYNNLYNVSDGQSILFMDIERYRVAGVTNIIGSGV